MDSLTALVCGLCVEREMCSNDKQLTEIEISSGSERLRVDMERRGLALSVFTVVYNVVEGLVSVVVALSAGSIALLGFGVDSFIESLSGVVMVWRFKSGDGLSHEQLERTEARALKLVAWSLFILAAYLTFESVDKLLSSEAAEPTLFGIVIACVSLVVMPVLFFMKRSTAASLGSASLRADSKQTFACVLLSVALLCGLGLNYLFGLWWADPAAALFIVVFLVREGVEALKEERLCSC